MPAPTDYSAFSIPSGHTIVDDVGGSGGTPLDAAHLNPLRDDVVTYLEHHILGDNAVNQHPSAQIWETGASGEATAYANVAGTNYSQAQMNAMFRWILRNLIGGTTNAASLTSMISTWFARSDVANVNLFSLATLFGTATPNNTVNTVPLRGATDGEINLMGLLLSLPNSSAQPAALTMTRTAGQTKPFLLVRDESLATLAQMTAAGLMQAVRSLVVATDPTTVAVKIQAAASPTADIWQVTDSAGLPVARVSSGLWVVAKNGYYTGAVGSEKQVIDASGNFVSTLLTPRQHSEFILTPSASALTVASTGGKYVDSVGAGQIIAANTTAFTVTSDATKYVWWAISYGNGGVQHVAANTAGGNATAGSALKANFPQTDYPIGYLRVPPGATTLAAAVYEDWRGAHAGDGNDGAGGGAPIVATYITTANETATLANSTTLATALGTQAANIKPVATDAPLTRMATGGGSANLLGNPASVLALAGNTVTIAVPVALEIQGAWRYVTGSPTVASNAAGGAAGVLNLYAESGGAYAGLSTFGLVLTSSAITASQRLLARYWWDGATLRPRADYSPLVQGSTNNTTLDFASVNNSSVTLISAATFGAGQVFATYSGWWPRASVIHADGTWSLQGTTTALTQVIGGIAVDGLQATSFWNRTIPTGDAQGNYAIPGKVFNLAAGAHTIDVRFYIGSGNTTTVSHNYSELNVMTYSQ